MPACLVCSAHVPPGSVRYRALLRCPACGFVFADLSLTDAEIRALYSSGYFHGEEYADYEQDRALLQRNFAARAGTLARFAPGGRLYEIGAAYGFFLELARARWDVAGIDIAEEAATYARTRLGLDVACGEFLDAPLEPAAYDVVCLWDTLEHLRAPDRYLEKAAAMLKPGGHLALTTGDIGSATARLQGRRWRLIHPPTHLYYFSVPTVTRLLARYGFEVVDVSHPGYYRSAGAMLEAFAPGLYRRLAATRVARTGIYLNLWDIMMVVARKAGSGEVTAGC